MQLYLFIGTAAIQAQATFMRNMRQMWRFLQSSVGLLLLLLMVVVLEILTASGFEQGLTVVVRAGSGGRVRVGCVTRDESAIAGSVFGVARFIHHLYGLNWMLERPISWFEAARTTCC